MRKNLLTLIVILMSVILLEACSNSNSDAPGKAVENYWDAIASKDANRLQTLVCSYWENDAMTAMDALQAVSARLDNVACSQTGTDGDTTLVNCTGNMVLTYDTEDQQIDLSVFTYEVVQQGGDWLVCGTR